MKLPRPDPKLLEIVRAIARQAARDDFERAQKESGKAPIKK